MQTIYASSNIEKEFIQNLQNPEIEVVSFDIFETLAFRNVAQPIDIFKKVGQIAYVKNIFNKKSLFQEYRINAEKIARKNKLNNEDISLEDIYQELPLTTKQKKKILKLELQEEYKNLFINNQVERWISLAYQYKKKIILISDMYLSTDQINDLVLSKIKNKNLISNIFISNECKVTKSSGNLYIHVKDKLNINFKAQLHIGDKQIADIDNAKKYGIHTLHYNIDKNFLEMQTYELQYLNKLPKYNNYRILSAMQNPYTTPQNQFYFNLGATIYGPILFSFTHWLLKVAKAHNLKQIYFIMREGRIFKKYFDKLNTNINTHLIYASRNSTFLASFDIKTITDNGKFFYSYSHFSIEDIYKSLMIDIKNDLIYKYKKLLLREADLTNIDNVNLLQYVYHDLNNNIDSIEQNIQKEKNIFNTYLQQFKIEHNSMIVDFGANGTILKRIDKICNKPSRYNALFYFSKNGIGNIMHKQTYSFFMPTVSKQKALNSLYRAPDATEILFNGLEYTTISYSQINGLIVPVQSTTNSIDTKIIQAFDKGIDTFFELVNTYDMNKNLFRKSNLLLRSLARIIEMPTENEAKLLGNLSFDLGGGSSIEKKIIDNTISIDLTLDEIYLKHLNYLNYKRDSIPWIEGYITHKDPTKIMKHKGLLDYKNIQVAISNILSVLEEKRIKEVYVYGAGDFFLSLLPYLQKQNINIISIIDITANKGDYIVHNYHVSSLEKTIQNEAHILIASASFPIQIHNKIIDYCKYKNLSVHLIDCINGYTKFN